MPTYKKRKQLRSRTRSMKGGDYAYELLQAIRHKRSGIVLDLLEERREPFDYAEALYVASKEGNHSIVKILVERGGADVNSMFNGALPLHRALSIASILEFEDERMNTIKYLIERTNDINMANASGFTPLHLAILMPQNIGKILEIVNLLYQKGADVNKPSGDGRGLFANMTPYRMAGKKGYTPIQRFLVHKGAQTEDNDTLLFDAILHNNIDDVNTLIRSGANVNKKDMHGYTPVQYAAGKGYFNIMKVLIRHGADINVISMLGKTLLHIAVTGKDINSIKFLIERGLDINKADNEGYTPLFDAPTVEIAKVLIENGANVNVASRGVTPLHIACSNSMLKYAEFLLTQNIDVNSADENGNTPSHILVILGSYIQMDILELLIKHPNINVNLKNNDGDTPLHIASGITHRGTDAELDTRAKKFVAILLKHTGITVDPVNKNGDTPLIVACKNGHDSVADALLRAGADVNRTDNDGNTPLNIAASLKIHPYFLMDISTPLVNVLLDYKGAEDGDHQSIDINKANKFGDTPLHNASKVENENVVDRLINEGGTLLNVKNNDGNTPLHIACGTSHIDIVNMLLKKEDIEIDTENNEGKTPLHVASEKGSEDIVNLLLDNDARITDSIKSNMNTFPRHIVALLTRPRQLWKGWSRSDSTALDQLFENSEDISMCPFCLKIAYRTAGCMYMTHDCTQESRGGYYHAGLYNIFKNGSGMVSWCTTCGRPCRGHQHYILGLPDKSSLKLATKKDGTVIQGPAYEKNCANRSGGGGPLEKLARFHRLREFALYLTNTYKNKDISRTKAMNMLVEEAWKGPIVIRKNVLDKIIKDKKWNFAHNLFPENAIPAQPEAVQTHAPNVLRPEANASDPNLQPVYHPNGEDDFMGMDVQVVQFRHRKKNGEINTHENNKISLIGLKMFLTNITQNFSIPAFGHCFDYPHCDALLYPSELQILKTHEHELRNYLEEAGLPPLEEGELDALLAKYREKFNAKFSAAQGAAAQGGGMNGEPESIFVEAKHAMCAIPPKKGGRKTRRRQRVAKNKRATRKY